MPSTVFNQLKDLRDRYPKNIQLERLLEAQCFLEHDGSGFILFDAEAKKTDVQEWVKALRSGEYTQEGPPTGRVYVAPENRGKSKKVVDAIAVLEVIGIPYETVLMFSGGPFFYKRHEPITIGTSQVDLWKISNTGIGKSVDFKGIGDLLEIVWLSQFGNTLFPVEESND